MKSSVRTRSATRFRAFCAAFVLPLLLSLGNAGCVTSVGVKQVSPEAAHRSVTANVLSAGRASEASRIVLRRHDLADVFEEAPEAALNALHKRTISGTVGGGDDELFALAELSFLHAQDLATGFSFRSSTREESRQRARTYFLASAVYAYAFIFPEDGQEAPPLIDPRVRTASDIYNRAVAEGFASDQGGRVEIRGGTYALPFAEMEVAFDPAQLLWSGRRLSNFLPVADVQVEGLNNRYRRPGIGAAMAAKTEPVDPTGPPEDFVAPRVRVPTTAVLRLDRPRAQLAAARLQAVLDLYSASDLETTEIAGRPFPLEVEPSATLAATLEESRFANSELALFLGKALHIDRTTRLVAREPHIPGRIPIVLVHGTNSSPATWANLVNDLDSDARIRRRYQFWFFSYESGNPIAYSAMILRQSLQRAVAEIDSDGRDPCMQQMVVVGHSQGGLLTKMTAIDSGDLFWDEVSSVPFDEVDLPAKSRELAQQALFVEPLPFVRRVIFISTPHRGSFLAGPQIIRRLASRMIQFPGDLLEATAAFSGLAGGSTRGLRLERIPTSIDNMSPGHPFIRTLSSIPVVPGVAAHSIVAVQGDGAAREGNDGVVEYSSAHIDGVQSEFIVRSGHSAQSNPHTVEEVRRILLLHGEGLPCGEEAQQVVRSPERKIARSP